MINAATSANCANSSAWNGNFTIENSDYGGAIGSYWGFINDTEYYYWINFTADGNVYLAELDGVDIDDKIVAQTMWGNGSQIAAFGFLMMIIFALFY